MLNKKITIILLIKGRPYFTERWLDYVNKNFNDLNVIVADGSIAEEKYIISKNLFPNINIYTPNFPYDLNVVTYQNKILESINLVKTEYVCMMSNDDFIFKDSFESVIKFLDKNQDYSAGRGDIIDFAINSINPKENIYGNIYAVNKLYHSVGFENNDVTERLSEFNRCPNGLWHCIVRKSILKEIIEKAISNKIVSEQIFENLVTYHFLISGKIYFDSSLYLLHQVHSKMQTVGESFKNFETEIKQDKVSYGGFIEILTELLLNKKELDPYEARNLLIDASKKNKRVVIAESLLSSFLKKIKIKISKILKHNPYLLFILINIKLKLIPYKSKYKSNIKEINNFLKKYSV